MKVTLGRETLEGFDSAYLFRFDNGLILRTEGKLYRIGRDAKGIIRQQLKDTVAQLEAAGFAVEGKHHLN
jgi:hypothetical protein